MLYNSILDSFTNLLEQSSSWDKTFNIGNYNDTVDESLFWKFNLVKYNNKIINCHNIPWFHVHLDASNTGIACVFDVRGKKNICYRSLTDLKKHSVPLGANRSYPIFFTLFD